jgi:NTP pyrophosphatase (non-canonical NTP hydrolase)
MQVLKVDEELNELKNEIGRLMPDYFCPSDAEERRGDKEISYHLQRIADEAADVITAITSLEQALGIDEAARDEAQRRVNDKNRRRGRL